MKPIRKRETAITMGVTFCIFITRVPAPPLLKSQPLLRMDIPTKRFCFCPVVIRKVTMVLLLGKQKSEYDLLFRSSCKIIFSVISKFQVIVLYFKLKFPYDTLNMQHAVVIYTTVCQILMNKNSHRPRSLYPIIEKIQILTQLL